MKALEEEALQPERKLLLFLACVSSVRSLRQPQQTPSDDELLLHAKYIRFVESNDLREGEGEGEGEGERG
eukprot:753012-Hanusia_phi.AAC.12